MRVLPRVTFATGVAVALAIAPAPDLARAQQKFPTKPVRLLVSNPPGSQGDTLARMFSQKLSEHWGRPMVVDNRTGAAGTLAAGTVAKATPDGHTLLITAGLAINAAMQPSLPYDSIKDFAGVTQVGYGTQVLVVSPALGVKTVNEFIALAKSQPGKLMYGSSAVGTGSHLNGARFAQAAGIKLTTVAFKGGPASRCSPRCRSSTMGSCMRWRWPRRNARPCCRTCRRSRKRCPTSRGLKIRPPCSPLPGHHAPS